MNDQTFLEAARGLARRMISETGLETADRISHGFRLCVGRRPSPGELQDLTDLYRLQLQSLSGSAPDAKNAGEKAATGDFMAWTSVAQVLLNLDETISRP